MIRPLPATAAVAITLLCFVPSGCTGGSSESVEAADTWTETGSGLKYMVLRNGSGTVRPEMYDQVAVRYSVELPNGRVLLSTKGRPKTLWVGVWMRAFTEGVQLMVEGDRYRFRVPPELVRDPNNARIRGIPDGREIIFEMQLDDLDEVPQFRKPDPEVAKAHRVAKGLVYETLVEGEDEAEPAGLDDTVVLHWTSWNENGVQLDTTIYQDNPTRATVRELPVPFMKAACRLLKKGGQLLAGVPYKFTYAKNPLQRPANLPRNARSYWHLELVDIIRPIPVPDFVEPAAVELQSTASGLQYQIIEPGEGRPPQMLERVRCHYAGWTLDGKLFDSSYQRGEPTPLEPGKVVPGLTEALRALCKVGGKYRFVLPPDIAYGKEGRPPKIGPDQTLVFYVEVLGYEWLEAVQQQLDEVERGSANQRSMKDAPAALRQGKNVLDGPTEPPAFAPLKAAEMQKTESGLRYEVVVPGIGRKPTMRDVLAMHMTTWLPDGTLISSTRALKQPLLVPVRNMVRGLQEGVQLIKAGGQARFLVPPGLAFGPQGNPKGGIPAGKHVVYLVEFLGIAGTPPEQAAQKGTGAKKKRKGGKGRRKNKRGKDPAVKKGK